MRTWSRAGAIALSLIVIMAGTATPAPAGGGATRAYVANSQDNALYVLDPATNTVTDRIPSGYRSAPGIAVRPDGREVYLEDHWDGRIEVLSTATNRVVATIPVGGLPAGIAITPDSRRAYVSNTGPGSDSVTVIDTATHQVVSVIPTPEGGLYHPAVSPDGSRVYVGTERVINNFVVREITVISTATNRVTKVIRMPNTVPASRIIFAPDGSVALANTGAVIDVRTDTLVRDIPIGAWVLDFQFAPDSTGVYVADLCGNDRRGGVHVIDVASGATLRTLFTGRNPSSLELTPDNRRLYVVLDGRRNIAEVDAATGAILDAFGIVDPASPPLTNGIHLSGTAPAAARPGTRFPLAQASTGGCEI